MNGICAQVKQYQAVVPELAVGGQPLPNSLEPGIGQMAEPMQSSALAPDPGLIVDVPTLLEVKNTCYLCVLLGKEGDECRIKIEGVHVNGHTLEWRKPLSCAAFLEWGAEKSDGVRDVKQIEAEKLKRAKMQEARRHSEHGTGATD